MEPEAMPPVAPDPIERVVTCLEVLGGSLAGIREELIKIAEAIRDTAPGCGRGPRE